MAERRGNKALGTQMVKNIALLKSIGDVQRKGETLARTVHSGGRVEIFEKAGRLQLIALLQSGLYPHSRVLDIGSGSLRGGYWLIHFLDPGGYHGIEPNTAMLEAGKAVLFTDEELKHKAPRFRHNDDYDFSVFGVKFDFVNARSIWTHAPKSDIQKMLDQFVGNSTPHGVFLTSYFRPKDLGKDDYKGTTWFGRNHAGGQRGVIGHSFKWIAEECERRGLTAQEPALAEPGWHRWLHISRSVR